MVKSGMTRRQFLKCGTAALACSSFSLAQSESTARTATKFQIACMTLPYSQFPLQRALQGIQKAGYKFVAWGTTHREPAETPVMPPNGTPAQARVLGARCRDLGLEPLMMFSGIYPEDPKAMEVFAARIQQASAAGIPQVLTFGHTKGANRSLWIDRFKKLGPIAKDHGVMIVIKQHGGETGTGAACAEIVREVGHDSVKVNYDAGNVMDYLNLDPLADIKSCVKEIRGFCIKDHRNFPKDEDCGPGFGEIDHYKLLSTVAFTGLAMPLCCENIFVPVIHRPDNAAEIDELARRARTFLEWVIRGIQA